MITSPAHTAAVPGHATSFVAVAFGLLWLAIARSAHGTPLAVPALIAAATSLGLCLWLSRERRRLLVDLAQAQNAHAELSARATLCDAALRGDIAQFLAHSATLLGATHAWLAVDDAAGAPPHVYVQEGVGQHDSTFDDAPSWWQVGLARLSPWVEVTDKSARCAVALRQDDVQLGVLAFAGNGAPRTLAANATRLLPTLATLLVPMLLIAHLQRALRVTGEQASRERRAFLSNLSHKLRTPMTAVLGFAQILEFDEHLGTEHREFVREIETAGRALLDMLNELVGIARDDTP